MYTYVSGTAKNDENPKCKVYYAINGPPSHDKYN